MTVQEQYEAVRDFQRGATIDSPPDSYLAARGRAQAMARRIIIESHKDTYNKLVGQAMAEMGWS